MPVPFGMVKTPVIVAFTAVRSVLMTLFVKVPNAEKKDVVEVAEPIMRWFPVVVAPPDIVSPVTAVPPPIVDDAFTRMP